jgi:putative transcriptional regulator
MLTSVGSDDEKVMERAIVASEISRIVDRFSILIVERKHERDNINSTAVISNEELKKIDEPSDLTNLVAERGTKR